MAVGTLQHRRADSATVGAAVPAAGEIFINTDSWKSVIGDGVSVGGIATDGARQNSQTGTSYTIAQSDIGKIVTFTNASGVAVTLLQPSASYFPNQSKVNLLNLGAGTATITPTSSTINGGANLTLRQGEGAIVWSNGVGYLAIRGVSGVMPVPGGATGAIQYNSGGTFAGSVITGIVKANGASAPTAAVATVDYALPPVAAVNSPLFASGAGGFVAGARSGNTNTLVSTTGARTTGHILVWDGSGNAIDGGVLGGTTKITPGDAPPGSPAVGDGWWDSTGGQLYIWYNDGNSSQWVAASNTASGPMGPPGTVGPAGPSGAPSVGVTPPSSPSVGDLWFDSDSGQLYIWFNDGTSSQWVVANSAPTSSGDSFATVTKTANYTIVPGDTNKHFNTIGAGGSVTLVLPVAAPNLRFGFVAFTTNNLIVGAAGSNVIAMGAATTLAGGFARSSTPHSSLTVEAHDTNYWIATAVTGTWTLDS